MAHEISIKNNIIPFPNPVSDVLHLINLDLESEIQIFDIMGRKCDVKVFPDTELQVLKSIYHTWYLELMLFIYFLKKE